MHSIDWLSLFFDQNFNGRITKANFQDICNCKIGKNIFPNQFPVLKNLIVFYWLNFKKEKFKLICKDLFLKI